MHVNLNKALITQSTCCSLLINITHKHNNVLAELRATYITCIRKFSRKYLINHTRFTEIIPKYSFICIH